MIQSHPFYKTVCSAVCHYERDDQCYISIPWPSKWTEELWQCLSPELTREAVREGLSDMSMMEEHFLGEIRKLTVNRIRTIPHEFASEERYRKKNRGRKKRESFGEE